MDFTDKEINRAENEIKVSLKKTDLKKSRFIDEIMSGYGEEIKTSLKPKPKVKKVSQIRCIYNKFKKWMIRK